MTKCFHGICRAAEKLVLGPANISTAGVRDIEQANLIAYEMILKYGYSKRLGPVALMAGESGYLGENSCSVSDMGPEMSAIALAETEEVILVIKVDYILATPFKKSNLLD